MKYTFADFNWETDEKYNYFSKIAKDYLSSFECADFSLSADEKDLEYERSITENKFTEGYLEYIAFLRKVGEILPCNDAFILHSACFEADGEGIAFAAKSGTGKTTHLNRWQSFLGDKLNIINGDKPIIRFINGEPFAYGTPWCGKEGLGNNIKAPLKHICFIERSDTNFVEKVEKQNVIDRIFNQVYMPVSNPILIDKTMKLVDKLLSCTKLWIIHCNLDENAGEIIYKEIKRLSYAECS